MFTGDLDSPLVTEGVCWCSLVTGVNCSWPVKGVFAIY